jgi:preprotein translocase subunit SecF
VLRETKFKFDYEKIFNSGINQTLSRTLITSFTTILSALILFIFGGEVIKGFMFAMLIGFFVGVITSIFVASPITMDLIINVEKKTETKS